EESRAPGGGTGEGNFALEGADDLAGDPEADAESDVGSIFIELYEAFEDALLVGLGDPDTVVGYGEADGVVVGLEADLDGALVAIEDGIGKEVGGDLCEARAVASDEYQIGRA